MRLPFLSNTIEKLWQQSILPFHSIMVNQYAGQFAMLSFQSETGRV